MQLSPHPQRRRMVARLRPLMLALCCAGYGSAALSVTIDIPADTLPTGMTLVRGNATVEVTGNTMTATQTSTRAVWQASNFSVGSLATFANKAADAQGVTLIRVIQVDSPFGLSSVINGSVTSQNRLLLVNPFGIYVGKGAVVDGSSLLMSAKDLDEASQADGYQGFMEGQHIVFDTGSGFGGYGGYGNYGSGVVDIDPGAKLVAADGGGVMLVGERTARNQGLIQVGQGGQVTLVAAANVEVDVGDSGFIKLSGFNAGDDLVTRVAVNTGGIDAPNGSVTLAGAGYGFGFSFVDGTGQVLSHLVQRETTPSGAYNSGRITAQGSGGGQGGVELIAVGDNGTAVNQGRIDVSALDAGSRAGGITMGAANVIVDNAGEGRATLTADGPAGGGEVTLHNWGTPASSESSTLVYVGANSVVSADATGNGQGGLITLSAMANRSSTETSYTGVVAAAGTLRARGGEQGGHGGRVVTEGQVVSTEVGGSQANIDVRARAAGATGGLWSLYTPWVSIGQNLRGDAGPSVEDLPGFSTYVSATEIEQVLNQGSSVLVSAYRPGANPTVFPGLEVQSGTQITRTAVEGGGSGPNSLTLQSSDNVQLGDGVGIRSSQGAMGIQLLADADGNGLGSLYVGDGNAEARLVRLSSNGGDITLRGAQQTPDLSNEVFASASAGVQVAHASIDAGAGAIDVSGRGVVSDGVRLEQLTMSGQRLSVAGTSVSGDGVRVDQASLGAEQMNLTGRSSGATGVHLNESSLSTQAGAIKVLGISEGTVGDGPRIGVDIVSAVQVNMGQGKASILGLADGKGGERGVGLRILDLRVTTAGGLASTPQLLTLVGQSVNSMGPGIEVNGDGQGLSLIGAEDSDGGVLATADVVIGASADSTAPQAMVLGSPSWNNPDGHINIRPLGVGKDGQVTEALGTAIHVGSFESSEGVGTNFIVAPEWFNPGANQGIDPGTATVIGSSQHTGRITVANEALAGAGSITLQNQGLGAGGILLGMQSTPVRVLNLLSSGPISQAAGSRIVVDALRVIAGPQASVQLNASSNQITTLSYSGQATPVVQAQAKPSSTTASDILGFDTTGDGTPAYTPQFQTLAISQTQRESGPVNPIDDLGGAIDGPEVLNDLRTDVYVRGQFNRPLVCTAANTSGTSVIGEAQLDPLSQEWMKVRRAAQLTTCSGVRSDSNCSAF